MDFIGYRIDAGEDIATQVCSKKQITWGRLVEYWYIFLFRNVIRFVKVIFLFALYGTPLPTKGKITLSEHVLYGISLVNFTHFEQKEVQIYEI